MKNEDKYEREQESQEVLRGRREFLLKAGLSGLALSTGVLSLASYGAAQGIATSPKQPPMPLYKSLEPGVLMRGPDGGLYLVPQSALKPFKVPQQNTKSIMMNLPELQKPLGKIPGSLAVRLGLVKADDVPTVYKAN